MPRWEPNSREKLQGAALELFSDHGYANTTVAEIAARVGVTERTFYRQFGDKRDVLFAGYAELAAALETQTSQAPAELGPLDAIAFALAKLGADASIPRRYLRMRQKVIAATPELRERELIKFSALAVAFRRALAGRGIEDRVADLAAGAGITIYRAAYASWTRCDTNDFSSIVTATLNEFRSATAP